MNQKVKLLIFTLTLASLIFFGAQKSSGEEIQLSQKATSTQAILSLEKIFDINEYSVIDIKANPNGQILNAVGLTINFSTQNLKVEKIYTGNSFCLFFVENNYSNEDGVINLACGLPSPGINKEGLVAQIVFRHLSSEITTIKFSEESQVLANDGFGTNILNEIKNLNF